MHPKIVKNTLATCTIYRASKGMPLLQKRDDCKKNSLKVKKSWSLPPLIAYKHLTVLMRKDIQRGINVILDLFT